MARKFPVTPLPTDSEDGAISYNIDGIGSISDTIVVIGDKIFLSQEGIEIVAATSGNFEDASAYTFRDSSAESMGGMYGRDDAGQNIIGLRVVDDANDDVDTLLQMESLADASDATATVNLSATLEDEGQTTYINLERADGTSEIDIYAIGEGTSGRVRISPKLNLLGASNVTCDVYIKGANFIIRYVDGATTRYKYLTLSGTGVTWVHSTTEP